MTNPLDGLRDDMASQLEFLRGRAPVYAKLLAELMQLSPGVERRLRDAWAGRRFGAWYERPLLLLASLRNDALHAGPSHPLWPAIGAREADPAAVDPEHVERALSADRGLLWKSLETRHLQTNDPFRAVAWLWPAKLMAEGDARRPLTIFDIGASAGLNLVADRLPPCWTRQGGADLDVTPLPPIADRVGFDLRPVDVMDAVEARWLAACVWPGQLDRLDRLEASIAAFQASTATRGGPRLEAASVADVPARLPRPGANDPRVIAYQTIMRDYVPPDELRLYSEGMRQWLAACARGAALWVELEVSEDARRGGPPAAVVAHARGADGAIRAFRLASCEPHPLELLTDDANVRALVETLAVTD